MSEKTQGLQEPQIQGQPTPRLDANDPFSQFESPNFDFNPLNEAVKERSYTKPNIDPAMLEGDLDEPTFDAPSFDDMQGPSVGGGMEDAGGSEPDAFANPALNDLDAKDKRAATAQMVDTVLDGYERLTGLANNLVQIPEDKVGNMVASGELNPNIRIPIDSQGNTISVPEFVDEFNQETSEAITTTEDFKETVRPAMNRVFAKRGLAMTDEQFLMYHFGMDLATKGIMVVQLRRKVSGIFDMLKEQSVGMPRATAKATVKKAPVVQTAPEPEPTPEPPKAPKPKVRVMKDPFDSVDSVTSASTRSIEPEDSFVIPEPKAAGAPDFGNPEILSQLEQLSEEAPKQKKSTTTKTATAKTPMGRKRGRPRKNA